MFWYETQFRNAEAARQRNKREERKLNLEIERKNGMRAVFKTQIEAVSKEQRRIKRELDRAHKRMIGPMSVFNRLTRTSRLQVKMPSCGEKSTKRKTCFNLLTCEYLHGEKEHENDLMRSLMSLDCESGSNSNNDFFDQDFKGQFNDLTTNSELTNNSTQQTTLNDCNTGIYINNSSGLQTDDNLKCDTQSQSSADDFDSSLFNEFSPNDSLVDSEDVLTELRSDRLSNAGSRSNKSGPIFKHLHKHLDLSQVASLDMKSVKSNVTRRLSGTSTSSQSEFITRRASDGNVALAKPIPKVPPTRRRISDGQFPSSKKATLSPSKRETTKADETQKQNDVTPEGVQSEEPASTKKMLKHPKVESGHSKLEYNPEYYNPDGSLRAKWKLQDPDEAWKSAREARYLRTSEVRECEKELSVNEIFSD